MNIAGVAHALPSKRITNEWILDRVRAENAGRLSRELLAQVEEHVRAFLAVAGTETRYQVAEGERAIDFALDAGRRALERAALSAADVDFLIYVGVGRGWIEPAMANIVQAELGLRNATCFDVLDACASWLRALQIAHSYLRSGAYRRGLIINCECGFKEYGEWTVSDLQELDHRFATCTIGEAATATVVTNDAPDDDFYFRFRNFGEHHALCMIPLPTAGDFATARLDARYAPLKFFSLSRELLATTTRKIVETFDADPRLRGQRYDICFSHAASEKAVEVVARRLGFPLAIHYATHPAYGNTVSASVPLGMSLAFEEGRLQRGDRVLVIVGASGITVGIATFTF